MFYFNLWYEYTNVVSRSFYIALKNNHYVSYQQIHILAELIIGVFYGII